jgi:uncharacterized protein (DUF58 family)
MRTLLTAGFAPLWASHDALHGIHAKRKINPDRQPVPPIRVGDDLDIMLVIRAAPRPHTLQLEVVETCPLVAPGSPNAQVRVLVSLLTTGSEIKIAYRVTAQYPGRYTFPAVTLRKRGILGLYRRYSSLHVPPNEVMVYPTR